MIKKILLWLYPTAWRQEYGEEFADVLSSRPLTLLVIANVLSSAAYQRLRHAPEWLPGSVLVFLVSSAGVLYEASLLSEWHGWMEAEWQKIDPYLFPMAHLGLLGTAAWGVAKKNGSFGAGFSGTIKATLVGWIPQIVYGFTRHATSITIGDHTFSGPVTLDAVPNLVLGSLWHMTVEYAGVPIYPPPLR